MRDERGNERGRGREERLDRERERVITRSFCRYRGMIGRTSLFFLNKSVMSLMLGAVLLILISHNSLL